MPEEGYTMKWTYPTADTNADDEVDDSLPYTVFTSGGAYHKTSSTTFKKTLTLPYDGNYSLSLKVGAASDLSAYIYVGGVAGKKVTIAKTGAVSKTTEQLLLENLPIHANESFNVVLVLSSASKTIGIEEIIMKYEGELNPTIDSMLLSAFNYTSADGSANQKYGAGVRVYNNSCTALTYTLQLAAGNYKIEGFQRLWGTLPTYGIQFFQGDTVVKEIPKDNLNSDPDWVDLGVISVTNEPFTLKFFVPDEDTAVKSNKGVIFFDFSITKIETPSVTVHSVETEETEATGTNIVSALSEGILNAKAYIPASQEGKDLTVLFAIYETENGKQSLYKVEKTTIENAEKNQVVNVPISGITFEAGKQYSSKVFFLNDMTNIQAIYKTDGILTGALAETTEESAE